jgi:hypothetical protein
VLAERTPALRTLSDEQAAVNGMGANCPSTGAVAAEWPAVSGLLSDAISQLTALRDRLNPGSP